MSQKDACNISPTFYASATRATIGVPPMSDLHPTVTEPPRRIW